MEGDDEREDDAAGIGVWRRAGWAALGLLLALGIGIGVVRLFSHSRHTERHVVQTVTRVLLPPPPPPPPPPKPQPEPLKPTELPKIVEPKPEAARPKQAPSPPKTNPVAAPPGNPLTGQVGPGANPYGLAPGDGGGDMIGGGGGGGGGGGFAQAFAQQIQSALQQDDTTRSGRYSFTARIWLSDSGAVSRIEFDQSTGEQAALVAAKRLIARMIAHAGHPPDPTRPIILRFRAQPT